MFRLRAATGVMSRPSNRIRPSEISSRPAMQKRRVLFPQPDGPTNETKAPSGISRASASRPGVVRWLLLTLSMVIALMASTLHRPRERTLDEETLEEEGDQHWGKNGQHACREHRAVL